MHNEVKLQLASANREYHTIRNMLLSPRFLSKETKMKLYLVYLRSFMMYACETWSTVSIDKLKLLIFERKISIMAYYGPIILAPEL